MADATKNINAEKIQGNLAINSVSATTLSAVALSPVNYIDFNTGSTTSNNSGRLFYDNISESLVYNSGVNQNVNIRVGRQLYTRVINKTGTLIPKGSAVKIQSSFNEIPSISLAIATNTENNQV